MGLLGLLRSLFRRRGLRYQGVPIDLEKTIAERVEAVLGPARERDTQAPIYLRLNRKEWQAFKEEETTVQSRLLFNELNGLAKPYEVPSSRLESAAQLGRTWQVKVALQQGDDVNARGAQGFTALHAAAESGHLEVVTLLIAAGADVHLCSSTNHSARQLAEIQGHKNVAAVLARCGG